MGFAPRLSQNVIERFTPFLFLKERWIVMQELSILMGNNITLHTANRAKKDEFYTQLSDIENELRHYKKHFKGKVVFCNCDDPYESNFFKYFAMNFNALGLKKLIATCYAGSPVAERQLSLFEEESSKESRTGVPHKIVITEVTDMNGDGATNLSDVEWLIRNNKNVLTRLKGDGDFRSPECVALLKEADIVVTNPPFSLFRQYVAQLIENEKDFLIIGNVNAITYKEIFPLIKNNKIWLGPSITSGDRKFNVPDNYPLNAAGCGIDSDGRHFIRVKGVRWFTNLDHNQRHEKLDLFKQYNPNEYQKYDNYNAINVEKTAEIPLDYEGIIGVPITFLDKYCPEQFELLGITSGRNEFNKEAWPTKKYINPLQVNADGTTANGSKINTRSTILLKKEPIGKIYYTAENADGPLSIVYARILIRKKQ